MVNKDTIPKKQQQSSSVQHKAQEVRFESQGEIDIDSEKSQQISNTAKSSTNIECDVLQEFETPTTKNDKR